jgi:signal transduction histidine kinase
MSPNPDELRLLQVESDDDAQLIAQALRRGGLQLLCKRVETAEAMRAALREAKWDLVISDAGLPAFDAPSALSVLQEHDQDIPFIVVSSHLTERAAVTAMKAGAHDWVAKDDLVQLAAAVRRELRDAQARRADGRGEMMWRGELVAGIGHELNNPLSALFFNLEFATEALQGLLTTPCAASVATSLLQIRANLRDALEAGGRVRQIAQDLQMVWRGGDERPGPVALLPVLESAARLARHEIRARARLVWSLQPVPAVLACEARLGQVFLNLLVNAAQAIAPGDVDANEIRILTRRHDATSVAIEIRDTGSGMPSSVRERLFMPFVTTKPQGTGLGLSICQRIVSAAGGSIQVESQDGKGTSICVLLPSAEA